MDKPILRNVTIGATINLENYESLRVEISGEVAGPQDVAGLVSALDRMLADLGRGDPHTTSRIDSYRRRVLAPADPGSPQKTLVMDSELPTQDAGNKTAGTPTPVARDEPPGPVTENRDTVAMAQCAQCGAEVSKSQAKLSQMLAGKVLCTICFDTYIKPRTKS